MSKKSAKTFNQAEESDDELYMYIYIYIYIYLIYSEADRDHTKYLVEPQLREGVSCEWTKPCKQIILIMKGYKKH